MQDSARRYFEGKEMALGGLIEAAGDRHIKQATKQKGADAAMGHESYVAFAVRFQDAVHGLHHALLRVGGALPAPNAVLRLRKKGMGNLFELGGREEARGGAIVLAKARVDPDRQTELRSQQASRLDGFRLGARPNSLQSA